MRGAAQEERRGENEGVGIRRNIKGKGWTVHSLRGHGSPKNDAINLREGKILESKHFQGVVVGHKNAMHAANSSLSLQTGTQIQTQQINMQGFRDPRFVPLLSRTCRLYFRNADRSIS